MNNLKFLVLLSILGLLLGACAPSVRHSLQDVYPKMYEQPPITILIMPPLNNTSAADAKEYFACSLGEAVGLKGYYPFSTELAFTLLRDEGLYDSELVNATVLRNYKKYFDADAVLIISINKWDKTWILTSSYLTISANYELVSTLTAETLWDFSSTISVDLSSGSDNLLFALVETAVKTAIEDYFPNARAANIVTMQNALPFGKHHPSFGLDAENPAKANKQDKYKIRK